MVRSATRKAERAKAFAEGHAKSIEQTKKNAKKSKKSSTSTLTEHSSAQAKPDASHTTAGHDADSKANEHDTESPADTNTSELQPEARSKNHRFILFIGNLPFNTTTSQIESHFASVYPSSIRHSTDKSTGKSKGFAFLEFDEYTQMTTCLKTFHHSLFPSGGRGAAEGGDMQEKTHKSKGEGRRINVELTVGGGGSKSTARKMKLRAKNEKLAQERRKNGVVPKQRDVVPSTSQEDDADNHIHPSRRAKVTF